LPRYTVQAPDGKTIILEGPEGASQDEVIRQAQALYQQQDQKAPAAYEPGRARGGRAVALADTPGEDRSLARQSGARNAVGGMLDSAVGATRMGFGFPQMMMPGAVQNALSMAERTGVNPNDAARSQLAGQDYEPQTFGGRVNKSIVEFTPNALMGPAGGARGAVMQAGTRGFQVVAPAVASEGAAAGVNALGGGQGAQDAARVTAAIATGGLTGAKRAPNSTPAKAPTRGPVPTSESLAAQKSAAYQAVEGAGVTYSPRDIRASVDGLVGKMRADHLDPELHPKASALLKILERDKGKPMTLTQLDQKRQLIRREVMNGSDGEKHFGGMMIDAIDELIESNQAGGAVMREAREANTRFRKVEAVEDAVETARNRVGGTGSGGNIDNAVRQNLRRVMEKTRNLTPQEQAALQSIVRGGKGQNALRAVGKLAPGGNGLSTWANIGSASAFGPLGALPAIAGSVAKGAADGMTMRKMDNLVRLMARGGPQARAAEAELAAAAATNPEVARVYNGVAELLLRGGAAGAISAQAANQ
jgi:hypothetical protein